MATNVIRKRLELVVVEGEDTRDSFKAKVTELMRGRPVRVAVRPLAPGVEHVFDSLHTSLGSSADRVIAECLARALVSDWQTGESYPLMVSNPSSLVRTSMYYWPANLSSAMQAEADSRGWLLSTLVEHLVSRYVLGWATEIARHHIAPIAVTS